jgi:predicted transcriptional regulator
MATTIQVSEDLKKELTRRKVFRNDTYEDIIWDLLEDTMELSEKTKRHIAQSLKEVAEGKVVSLEEVERRLSKKR